MNRFSTTAKTLDLPILDVVKDIQLAMVENQELILEAPPGAGKTTVVPLALLEEVFLNGQKIIMLEPRRLAARGAAERMSTLLGETVGETVGYRVRMDHKISKHTKIEVLTEGMFVRRLQSDPELNGVGLVIFDEFHERHLDGDLSLALVQQCRELFREDESLKLIIMSATLDGDSLKEYLPHAPVIRSLGRQFPVDVIYQAKPRSVLMGARNRNLADLMADTIATIISKSVEGSISHHDVSSEPDSILCFLPGQAEIRRTKERLEQKIRSLGVSNIEVTPLYGDLKLEQQRAAIAAPAKGVRKIVLATDIAESSLTIQGVNIVVDSGLRRSSAYDPNTSMSRLHTETISRASSEQRAGRAGRLAPGRCYRLWNESEQAQLKQYNTPEILTADLAELLLQSSVWGASDIRELEWLSSPPTAALSQASDTLNSLAAIEGDYQNLSVTPHGEALSEFPAHPRISHMLIKSAELGVAKIGAQLACLLLEKDPVNRRLYGADVHIRWQWLTGDNPNSRADNPEFSSANRNRNLINRMNRVVDQFYRRLQKTPAQASALGGKRLTSNNVKQGPLVSATDVLCEGDEAQILAYLLAFAYPERIAQKIEQSHDDRFVSYLLSNGRRARLPIDDPLSRSPYIVVAELGGHVGDSIDNIYLAGSISKERLLDIALGLSVTEERCEWSSKNGRFVAERLTMIGPIILQRSPLKSIDQDLRCKSLMEFIKLKGLGLFNVDEDCKQFLSRAEYYREHSGDTDFPEYTENSLLETLDDWAELYLQSITKLIDLKKINLLEVLKSRLSWQQQQKFDGALPLRLAVPSGSRIKIDYCQVPPVLAVKLQEMFGLGENPSVMNGKLTISLHLLSPGKRPLSITQDLQSFWRGAYSDVKKEMRGRYPKHPWPDEPWLAQATAKTNARLRAEK